MKTFRFTSSQALPFFPTLVWVRELAPSDYEPMNRQLLAIVEEIITPRPPLEPGQTWQTRNDLHKRADMADFLACVHAATAETLEFLQVDYDSFEVTGCWGNVNPSGSPHATHSHPNNFLSGVYYVRVAPGGDSITFHEPRPQLNIITPKVREQNNFNTSQVNLPVKEGQLVMFPSWFRHSVLPNKAEVERVSVSFNIMFSSFTETVSPPKWQGIG
ncbi:MAG: 2OG-Fe(II) oxygenase family protein [Kiloniellales bacterium]|nr:2OG-Fe(II) oxygenase family protein [Kiloniellales bacterium]